MGCDMPEKKAMSLRELSISISMVVYNPDLNILRRVLGDLKTAILKVLAAFPVCFTLYVIDNNMAADVLLKVKNIIDLHFKDIPPTVILKFVHSEKNGGYGYGNNLAIMQANSKYHLVMNPDVFVYPDSLLNAIQYMEDHPQVGLLAPDVYGEDGVRHYLCKLNPTMFDMYLRSFAPNFLKKMFAQRMFKFEMRDKDYDAEIQDVSFPTGCFMFARTEILQQLNGFDERFFLYFEDADIGRRLLKVSHSVYVPDVKVIHKWARASRKNLKMFWIFIKSAVFYWKKYGGLF